MCRNIRPLNNFEPPASRDEVTAAALQYVRKVAGTTKPSQANEAAFYAAVKEKTLTHDGNDRLASHIAHCVARSTPYGDLVTKDNQKSPKKIDAAIAAVVAYERASWHRMNRPKPKRWAVAR